MGLLTPLYLAGLAALSLPLVLHLIRRTPRGRQAFSSLMFLTPSPPRLTRRSRFDHLLLLLLRLTALALLAFAFARPFLRRAAVLPLDDPAGRRVAILLDTSASMRRGDLWNQAVANVESLLKDITLNDDVALYHFDDRLHRLVGFVEDAGESTAGKADLVRQRLKSLTPSWRATDLGKAMTELAGELDAAADDHQFAGDMQLVLITDLANGSRTEALQGYRWPERLPVTAQVLACKQTNAAVQLLADDEESTAAEPRVRVTNAGDSTHDQFSIDWQRPAMPVTADQPLATYVPAGQSRVIRLPRPDDPATDRIVLRGDDADFDNTYFTVPPAAQQVKVIWIGNGTDDAESPRYYFELAVADDPLRTVEIETHAADDLPPVEAAGGSRLIVLTSALPAMSIERLKKFMNEGGTLLVVLNDADGVTAIQPLIDDVIVREERQTAESNGTPPAGGYPVPATFGEKQYSLLGEIDFTHPLFASFAKPRYGDFTKIHFWRHLPVSLSESAATRVVARFDNGDPAILERIIGAGRVCVFTSGWQPEVSQLALSSKFVPLVQSLLDLTCGGPARTAGFTIGDAIPLPTRSASQAVTIEKPDGTRAAPPAEATTFADADQPGIYRMRGGETEYPFAVNLTPAESNTAPMELERLEQLGVRFANHQTRAQRAEQLRQQRDTELESRQRLWRWLIVAAIAALIVETWLAGRAARKLETELLPVT